MTNEWQPRTRKTATSFLCTMVLMACGDAPDDRGASPVWPSTADSGAAPGVGAGPGTNSMGSPAIGGPGATPGAAAVPSARDAGTSQGPALTPSGMQPLVDAGGTAQGGVPCDVAAIISKHCAECHGTPLAFGAPMPLLTLANFQGPAFSNKAKKVYELIPDRLAPADTNRKMPPTSKPALSASELATLKAWAGGGASASTASCAISDMSMTAAGDAGMAMAGSGGAHITPIEYNDPDMECFNFLTYADGNKAAKYPVAAGAKDMYINFYFKAPWQGVRYTRSVDIITDNKTVIHHWLLFNNQSASRDGTVTPGSGTHGADEELLYGWAPGASPMYLDPDVGQKLEGGSGFTLEAHYNNPTSSVGPDASGAKVCVTKKVPTHEAGLSWVGSDSIFGTSATGTCTPQAKEIHLIVAQPHMHKKGKHMKVVINRSGGKQEVIHDEDFSFDNQRYYPLNVVMQPGDTMTTNCTYNGIAQFGKGTEQEMCYFFTLHWPAGALTGGTGGFLHGGYSCL